MAESSVEIISDETVFQGFFRASVVHLRHKRPDGSWTGKVRRELFRLRPAVAILCYDPVRDAVVMIQQFRLGAYTAGMAAWQLEAVAGLTEAGENPVDVAIRETKEETGCTARFVEPIQRYMPSPGVTTEIVDLFVACVDATEAKPVCGLIEENEYIETRVTAADELIAKLDRGEIENAISVTTLQWFARHRPRLREKWLAALETAE